tara:strand:+ start:1297 stop:1554 length:258 start_codon:yes stop_codon:yes gene_type:complete
MVRTSLNDSEQALYDYMARHIGKDVTIEELSKVFYEDRPRPPGWYGSVAATMRMLMLRVSKFGLKDIERTSRLGTASKATYRMVA